MPVAFKTLPSNLRVPLFFAELDASKANNAPSSGRGLIIAQMIGGGGAGTGDATPNIAIQSLSVADAKLRFGLGSIAAKMVAWWRKRDPLGELWVLPLADAGGAVAATGSISFTGPATAAGTLSLYLGGHPVPVTVTSGMTAAQLATAIVAAITAITDLPVTAAVDGVTTSKVNLTAKNKGTNGNDVDIRLNYRGSAGGEATPAGLVPTILAMANGATDPTLTAALANLGDAPFDFIACPFTDATSLDALKAFLGDQAGRWSYVSQQYGGVFSAYRGTVAQRTTFGVSRNDQHVSVLGFYDSPTPAWLWAANYAGAAAASLRADPALPLQTLMLDVLAPPIPSRDTLLQRNVLLFDGISTFNVAQDGTVVIENAITTYQTNAFGQPDDSYLQVETLYTLAEYQRQARNLVQSKYGRMKLVSDGVQIPAGARAVSPNTVRADLIAQYRSLEGTLVEDANGFAAALIVERDANNPRRLNVLLAPNLINSIGVFAALIQFSA